MRSVVAFMGWAWWFVGAFMAERVLCVYIASFELQLARQHEGDEASCAVLVGSDRLSSFVLEASESALSAGIFRGMRYGAAMGLAPGLRAYVHDPQRVRLGHERLSMFLESFSPLVEWSSAFPGVFWLRSRGLSALWSSSSAWSRAVLVALRMRGFRVGVVCGFSRFGTMICARALQDGGHVFALESEERSRMGEVPMASLGFPVRVVEELSALGCVTAGDLQRLPVGDVRLRYGEESAFLVSLAQGRRDVQARAWSPARVFKASVDLDEPLSDASSLLFRLRPLLESVFSQLEASLLEASSMSLELVLDWPRRLDEELLSRVSSLSMVPGEPLRLWLSPSSPSNDVLWWQELFRLRFERLSLVLGVKRVCVSASALPSSPSQGVLSVSSRVRDASSLLAALSRVRAEFGDASVGVLEARDAHLPEARQGWGELRELAPPSPAEGLGEAGALVMVRRVLSTPQGFSPGFAPTQEGLSSALRARWGAVCESSTPWVTQGGWWVREVVREYRVVRTTGGARLWVYWDARRGRWFLQGTL